MKKQILALGLTFAICITSGCNAELLEAKGKKVELNKKKVTLVKGKSFKLNLKNNKKKVKWCVDKKKIVKLSKKTKKSVLLTAIKIGKAKVTAKVGRKKYVCKVTVSAKGRKNENATQMTENTQNVPQKDQTPKVTKTPTQISNVQETIKPEGSPNVTPKETLIPTAVPTSVPETTKKPVGPTVSVSGSVTDSEGTMLSGVKIGFCRSDYDGDYTAQFSATSDEKGNYTVNGLEKGKNYSARVYVMDNPYSDDWGVNVGTVVAGDTSTYALKVTMALTKVSGILVDAEGDPLMNLQVKLYESAAKRDKDECKTAFSTGEDGAYGQWLEKNKSYFVKICGNGNEYFPENINTAYENQDLRINENLVEVVATIKDKSGVLYRKEFVDLKITKKGKTDYNRLYFQMNNVGEICISISAESSCEVKIHIDGVTYSVGIIKAGQEDTYALVLDAVMKQVNLSLVYANQQPVDEFSIKGSAASYESTYWSGEDGKCSMRLKEGTTWGLKAYVHGKEYTLKDLKVGDESSYKKQLKISLKKFSGLLQTKDGMKLPEARVYFYADPEMKSSVYSTTTDADGQYEIWDEEGKTYYVKVQVSGVYYKIGKVEDNYNLTLDENLNLEKVELEVKNSEGKEYLGWTIYENKDGKKGAYVGAFNKSTILLLEKGKKYFVEIGTYLVTSDVFIAGSFTVGDETTYKIVVDEVKVNGTVKDSNGNILTSTNIVGTDNFTDLQMGKYKVLVKFKNTIDGTQKSTIAGGEDNKYEVNLIKGQEYSVTVSVAGKTYEAGTIVADKDKEQDVAIDAKLAAVYGKILDSNGKAIKAEKVCFYEDEAYRSLAYEGVVSEDGTYGLYIESGKIYYVQANVSEKISDYHSSYEYVPLGNVTATQNSMVDLKSSKMRVSGKVTDADGNIISGESIECYANQSDFDFDELQSRQTDSNGKYVFWIEPGTYDLRVSVPYDRNMTKCYSVGMMNTSDEDTYDKTLPMRRIKGKITGVSKEVLEECDLRLYDNESAKNSEYIDWITLEEDGTYQTKIYVKDNTRYFLRFGDDDYVSIGSVLSGDASTYDINVDQSFEKVSGKATFADGSPVESGTLYLYEKECGYDRKYVAYNIDDGKFETAYLQTGTTYYCEFRLDNIYYKAGSITVGKTDSYDQSIDKTLKRVSVMVKDAGNTVLDSISIKIMESEGESKTICSGWTSEDGVYESNYLEAGKTYTVSATVCGKEFKTNTFTVGKEDQYEVKIDANFVKAKGTVKKADNSIVNSGVVYLYESNDDDNYAYKEYAYISNGEYNNLRLETGKSYYVRVTDYSGSGYQNAGVITGGSASTYDIKIQK